MSESLVKSYNLLLLAAFDASKAAVFVSSYQNVSIKRIGPQNAVSDRRLSRFAHQISLDSHTHESQAQTALRR